MAREKLHSHPVLNQSGKVYIKVFWLAGLIISLILTLVLNLIF